MFGALYDFCRDQGSIIGGLLVLAAGYLVFSSVRHSANQQVTAVNAQTEAFGNRTAISATKLDVDKRETPSSP